MDYFIADIRSSYKSKEFERIFFNKTEEKKPEKKENWKEKLYAIDAAPERSDKKTSFR